MKWRIIVCIPLLAATLLAQQPADHKVTAAEKRALKQEEKREKHAAKEAEKRRKHAAEEAEKSRKRETEAANSEARYQIQSTFDIHGPGLISITVTSDTITLYGWVNSYPELFEAIQVANTYAEGREVINRISVGPPCCY